MNIGFIGLGKLGFPCAIAIANKEHKVYGYDISKKTIEEYRKGNCNLYEPDINNQLKQAFKNLIFCDSIDQVAKNSEIIFVAIQTPHPPELDGSIRFNHARKDFDYSFLKEAAKELSENISSYKIISIISTVLPGTTRREIAPILKQKECSLLYNPSFIAMGQTINDFLNPEFTLIGGDDREAMNILIEFYNTIHNAPKLTMSWEEAELTKVIYNTYIGFKIIYANTIMQICHKIKANCDVVTGALSLAKDRIVSPEYMKGGMSDGGGCHPRDNIALANFSDKLGLEYNLFDEIMTIREKQTEWIANLATSYNMPIVIMGMTYKPYTNLTAGSPALLLGNIIAEKQKQFPTFYDPNFSQQQEIKLLESSVFIIATTWPEFKTFPYPKGSIILDPWSFIEKAPEDVLLVRIGRNG